MKNIHQSSRDGYDLILNDDINFSQNTLIKYAAGDGNDTIWGFKATDTLIISGSYSTQVSGKDVIVKVGSGSIVIKDASSTKFKIRNADKVNSTTFNVTDKTKSPLTVGTKFKDINASMRTKAIKITGNKRDNVIQSGRGNDTLSGGAGKDFIIGNTGNDKIYGNLGNDTLLGNAGNDLLYGHAGDDSLLGGAGDDKIWGGAGSDELSGGADNDTLYGGSGNRDIIHGDAGDDVIFGNDGYDMIFGDAGNDSIMGNDDNDKLTGGDGDDTLIGGKGYDQLWGDAGNDTFVYENGDGDDKIYKFERDDALSIVGGSYSTKQSGDDIIVTVGKGKITLEGAATLDSVNVVSDWLTVTNSTKSPVNAAAHIKTIDATTRTKAVKITGNALDNSIIGGSGNDTILGGKGNDSLWGGSGNDTFIFRAGDGIDKIFDYKSGDMLKILNGSFSKSKFSDGTLSLTVSGGGQVIFDNVTTSTTFNINNANYKISGSKLKKQ